MPRANPGLALVSVGTVYMVDIFIKQDQAFAVELPAAPASQQVATV